LNYATVHNIRAAFTIQINGETVQDLRSNIASTQGWNNYFEKKLGQIHLDQGISTIRIQHNSEFGMNYHTLSTELVEADKQHEHSFGQWIAVDEEAHKQVCECGHEVSECHKWDDGAVITEATVDVEGEIRYTCTECQQTKTEKLPKLMPETTNPTTDPTTDPTTNDAEKEKGCGSAVSGSLAIACMMVAAGTAFLARKKKD